MTPRPTRAGRACRGIAAVLLLAPAACGSTVDARQALTCRRALPALVPGETGLTVLRVASGTETGTVRIDYALRETPNRAARQSWAVCRFGPGVDLIGLITERGAVSGASLYLLKRYYLDTPDAAAAEPTAP